MFKKFLLSLLIIIVMMIGLSFVSTPEVRADNNNCWAHPSHFNQNGNDLSASVFVGCSTTVDTLSMMAFVIEGEFNTVCTKSSTDDNIQGRGVSIFCPNLPPGTYRLAVNYVWTDEDGTFQRIHTWLDVTTI